jgi:hypothetical protein
MRRGTPYGSGYHGPLGGSGGGPGVNTNDSVLLFGAGQVGSTTTTRYLYPGYDDDLAQTVVVSMVAPYAGTLRDFFVRHNSADGNGNSIVYTVRVNGVASAVSVTLASGAIGQASDLANAVAVAAGDLIDIEVTKAASVGNSPDDVTATIDLKVA